jgi:hypothetical protein
MFKSTVDVVFQSVFRLKIIYIFYFLNLFFILVHQNDSKKN